MIEFFTMSSNQPLEQYIQAISSPDRNVRRKALIGLVQAGNIRVIPYLENVAREDSDAELQFLAKKGLTLLKAKLEFAELQTSPASSDKASTDLSVLSGHLKNQPPEMRARVVKAAVATRDPNILSVLIPHLEKETDKTVKGLILLAVAILSKGKNIALISKYLKDTDGDIRSSAIEALGATSSPVAYPFIVEGMNDKSNEVRSKAFAILIRLGKGNILKLLTTMLSSDKEWMNHSALRAAARFNSNEVVDLMSTHLNAQNDSGRLARKSLATLARAGNQKAIRLLQDIASESSAQILTKNPTQSEKASSSESTQSKSGQQTGNEEGHDEHSFATEEDRSPVSLDANATDLSSPDPRKRQKYLRDVILHNDISALKDISRALESEPDPKIKASMLITLGKLGNKDILETLTPWLKSSEDRLRASAVEAVSQIKGIDLSQLLKPALNDKDNRTRANVIVALIPYPDVDLMPPLDGLAKSTRIRDRLSAIYAITHMGTEESIKVLVTLTKDPSKIVARRADEALQILRNRKPSASPGDGQKKKSLTVSEDLPESDSTNKTDNASSTENETTGTETLNENQSIKGNEPSPCELTPTQQLEQGEPNSNEESQLASTENTSIERTKPTPETIDEAPDSEEDLPVPTRQQKKKRNKTRASRSRKIATGKEGLKKTTTADVTKEASPETNKKKASTPIPREPAKEHTPEPKSENQNLKRSRSRQLKTETKGSMPRGILLHGAGDLICAAVIAGFGVFLLTNVAVPNDEMIIPFIMLFLILPLILLAGGIGLFTGKPWGRHVNGFIFHVIKLPVISERCLTSLMQKESLAHLGLTRADFPEKLYYIVAASGAIMFYLTVSFISQ